MWIDVDLDGSIDGTALDIPCGHAESARNAVDKAYMDAVKPPSEVSQALEYRRGYREVYREGLHGSRT